MVLKIGRSFLESVVNAKKQANFFLSLDTTRPNK